MKDVEMLKPKKHVNKVGRLTQDPKLNKQLPHNPTLVLTAIKQNTKSFTYVG